MAAPHRRRARRTKRKAGALFDAIARERARAHRDDGYFARHYLDWWAGA